MIIGIGHMKRRLARVVSLFAYMATCWCDSEKGADVRSCFVVVQLSMEQLKDQILTQLFAGMSAVLAWPFYA